MKSYWLLLAVVLVVSACGEKKTGNSVVLTRKVDSLFADVSDFSGVLLIADKGKPLYHKAFGYKNFDTRDPVDTASIFELASVSKQFTSTIIMMLEEEGKLNYDDPLEKFIPGLPYKGVTIRHLLTHTSGLPDYMRVMEKYWDKKKVAGNKECIEYLKLYPPAPYANPGERYEYSNTGYMLLASIAEEASGIDFVSFARTRIFVPLEMTSTDIRSQEEKAMLRNMAWGHIWLPDKQAYIRADSMPEYNYGIWLGNRKGPGRISSKATDLLKWDQALYRTGLVSNETLNEAFTPMKVRPDHPRGDTLSWYGFGWMLQTHPELGKVVRHSGGNPGYSTHIVRYIDANKTIIMLCNNAHDKFPDLLKGVEALVAKRDEEMKR